MNLEQLQKLWTEIQRKYYLECIEREKWVYLRADIADLKQTLFDTRAKPSNERIIKCGDGVYRPVSQTTHETRKGK